MVGVGTRSMNLDGFRHIFCSLLGKDADSWGLSYYGRIQHKGRFQQVNGSRFGQGSIIGVHLDMWHGTLSFYKNRMPLGKSLVIHSFIVVVANLYVPYMYSVCMSLFSASLFFWSYRFEPVAY